MQLTEHQKEVKELYDRAYMKEHKKCRYCEWFYTYEVERNDPISFDTYITDVSKCTLKDKTISDNSRRALFCKYYNPEP